MAAVRTLEEHLAPGSSKRILSLDGGGVKGIITIAFLEKIEEILKERSGRGDDFRLSDYFDLVGGTSVGALLATLIARGHPASEIKRMFNAWAPEIFRHPRLTVPLFSPRFSSRGLKRRARELLGEQTLEDGDLKTGLAIITKRIDTGSPWVLTNNPRAKYWNDPCDGSYLGNRHYRIADLVCASAAAPYYFGPKRIRMVPRSTRPKIEPGLFIDGGVSPFNDPALMLLMLAGIKGYGYNWDLGGNHLLLVSVGTGGYRMRHEPKFLMRLPALFAAKSILGMMADSHQLSLTLLQWLSAPGRPWEINSEIGTMAGEVLSPADQKDDPKRLLSFVRYDTRLEEPWLTETIGKRLKQPITKKLVEDLKQVDRTDMMKDMYCVGVATAEDQVRSKDFPEHFDPQPGTDTGLPANGSFPPWTIQTNGLLRRKRLIARRRLNAADFQAVAVRMGTKPVRVRRIGLVAARQTAAAEEVETQSNGKESTNTAAPGDWIVTNLSPRGRVLRDKAGHPNVYVIRRNRFAELYDRHEGDTEFGAVYKPKSTDEAKALYFSDGFELLAPWDEVQQAPQGYLLLKGEEVYGVSRTMFMATYTIERKPQ